MYVYNFFRVSQFNVQIISFYESIDNINKV